MESDPKQSSFQENLSVTSLKLDGNKLGPKSTEYVSCVLYDNDNIKSLVSVVSATYHSLASCK